MHFFSKTIQFLQVWKKNLPNSGELERKNNIKIMKKMCYPISVQPLSLARLSSSASASSLAQLWSR